MKIVDANVLLYATNSRSAQHVIAHRWLVSALAGTEAIGFPWISLLAFVRLSTNPRVFDSPLSIASAFDLVDSWLAQPPATVVEPTARHATVLHGLLEQAGTAANLTTDAHLAALAVEHSAEVATFDRDFARFAVRVYRPQ
jgi:toxin-antitoxin system PIN domain toxin